MTIAQDFIYHKAKNAEEVLKLLAKYGNKAQILAGGTDLICWLKEDFIQPEALIDIKSITSLNRLELKENTLHIGALTTFSDLLKSDLIDEKLPLLKEMAIQVASMGIRNRATIAGNICSAVPSCDSGPILLVYDAHIIVKTFQGDKTIPIQNWFLGPKKNALGPGEFVSELVLTLPKEKHVGCYVKLGRYEGGDLAQASIAILLDTNKKIKIAFAALAPKPLRSSVLEKMLSNKVINDELIREVLTLVPQEISPITDIRATKEYRLHMFKVMLERGLKAVISRLENNTPKYGVKLI